MEMKLLSIKEYADEKHISYEAVRKQLAKYRDNELEGHIIKQKKTQYLDEYAVEFLDSRRRESPIVIMNEDRDEKISELTSQNEQLKLKILELQDQLIKSKDQLLERDQQLIELKDQLYLLTTKQENEPEEASEADADDDKTTELTNKDIKQPETQLLDEQKSEKKWWQFWK